MPIIDYVAQFEDKSGGSRYYPHVSLGVVDDAALQTLLTAEEEGQTERSHTGEGDGWAVESVFVFQLGDWGTVRKRLHDIPLHSTTAGK